MVAIACVQPLFPSKKIGKGGAAVHRLWGQGNVELVRKTWQIKFSEHNVHISLLYVSLTSLAFSEYKELDCRKACTCMSSITSIYYNIYLLHIYIVQAKLGYVYRSLLPTVQKRLNVVLMLLLMLEKRKE